MKLLSPLVLSLLLFSTSAFAIDTDRGDREAVITARSNNFYKTNRAKQFVNVGGSYHSDQSVKEYDLTTNYFYRSSKYVHEINAVHETNYTENAKDGSHRTKEFYDAQLSSKMMLLDTKNYIALYHRTSYDEFSSYYYDITNAIGFGHIFFGDKLEFDVSLGNNAAKSVGYNNQISTSIRAEFNITEKLLFTQRSYAFFSAANEDYQSRSRLSYPLSDRLDFTITHSLEKRRFHDEKKQIVINQVDRTIFFGIKYDLQ